MSTKIANPTTNTFGKLCRKNSITFAFSFDGLTQAINYPQMSETVKIIKYKVRLKTLSTSSN